MSPVTEQVRAARSHPHLPYVIPFVTFIALLQIGLWLEPLVGSWEYPLRVVLLSVVLFVFSRNVLDFRVRFPLLTAFVGAAVFVIWVAPDLLIPGYRSHWL